MTDDPPPRPLSAWVQVGAIIFVASTIFSAGRLHQRLVTIEEWRVQTTGRAEQVVARLGAVEALLASTQADLASIKGALARIERSLDEREP